MFIIYPHVCYVFFDIVSPLSTSRETRFILGFHDVSPFCEERRENATLPVDRSRTISEIFDELRVVVFAMTRSDPRFFKLLLIIISVIIIIFFFKFVPSDRCALFFVRSLSRPTLKIPTS